MRAYEIRMRAARTANQLYDAGEKAKGGGDRKSAEYHPPVDPAGDPKSLKALGISSQTMSEWRKLNKLSDEEFEAGLACG